MYCLAIIHACMHSAGAITQGGWDMTISAGLSTGPTGPYNLMPFEKGRKDGENKS